MKQEIRLTQEEQIRIRDLVNALIKKQDTNKKHEEFIGKIAAFIEGVKLGLFTSKSTT